VTVPGQLSGSHRDPLRFAPVFILCSARSCSSVITSMIGQHPELFGMPELKLFLFATIGELDASLPVEVRERGFKHRSPGLVRAVAELEYGAQNDATLAAAISWLKARPGWSGPRVFDLLMERVSPRIAIEKSPEHVERGATLARIFRAYPRARYLHLTRHPVTTIRSMNEHLQGSLPRSRKVDFTAHCTRYWLASNELIGRATSRLPAERRLQARAEDVLNDPVPNLRRIAVWLDVRADDAAIEAMLHPDRSPFACFVARPSGVNSGYDAKFLADPRPHAVDLPTHLEAPVEWQADPELWGRVTRAAAKLGYAQERDGASDPTATSAGIVSALQTSKGLLVQPVRERGIRDA
jgi:Sulfotransferase family